MNDTENNPPAVEIPPGHPVQTETPPGNPPPAATLATQGEVTNERALEIARREAALEERERRAREAEMSVAERERRAQEREEVLRHAPTAKRKRKRNFTDPVFAPEEIEED